MGLDLYVKGKDGKQYYSERVGSYGSFHTFRSFVCEHLEACAWGSRFPLLQNHSDCGDGYTMTQSKKLLAELEIIQRELAGGE